MYVCAMDFPEINLQVVIECVHCIGGGDTLNILQFKLHGVAFAVLLLCLTENIIHLWKNRRVK